MQGFRLLSEKPFAALFSSLFPQVAGLSWLALCEAFVYPSSWFDESVFDEGTDEYISGPIAEFERIVRHVGLRTRHVTTSYGYVSAEDIFPRYANVVSEDWTSIFGVSQRVADAEAWLKGYYASESRHDYLSGFCDIVFLNVDGAFWEVFARPTLLRDFALQLAAENVRCEPRSLSQCDYL